MMRPLFLPAEHTALAFGRAMQQWEASLKRPDLDERARVAGALVAYQSQLDACAIADATKGVGDLMGGEA